LQQFGKTFVTLNFHVLSCGTKGGSSGGAGGAQAPPTAATTMEPLLEPLLIFKGMKEMEERL
jgi:hypothetical protein